MMGTNLNTNVKTYYMYNPHGDVQGLINTSGSLTKTYEYDAFGNEIDKVDTDTNPWRYCGEYYDVETDNIYLRNRYYNPSTGTFITEDPIRDGGNWYSYCGENPVMHWDPSGETQRGDGKYNVETQKKILQYSKEYNEAKRKGDKKGMQEAARKSNNLRINENEATFFKDGVEPSYWNLATQAAFAGANASGLKEGSLEYGEFITEFLSRFDKEYNNIDAKYDAAMVSVLITQISSNMQQCFTGDTLVLTKTGYIKIKDIQEEDYVLSENTNTEDKDYKRVVRKFENETNTLVHILTNDIEISTTTSHPFYVYLRGWVYAGDLTVGDKLKNEDGGYVVIESIYIENLEYPVKVYNLDIEDWHTYFVSENMVLVHNMCVNNYSLKKIKNNKEANRVAVSVGYDNAEDLKRHYVGRGNESKFNMKIDSNSKEIVLEKISDSRIQVPTGLKVGDD